MMSRPFAPVAGSVGPEGSGRFARAFLRANRAAIRSPSTITTRTAQKGFADRLAYLKDTVLSAIAQRRIYARTVAELNGLTDRELADLGISRLGITDIAREAAYGK